MTRLAALLAIAACLAGVGSAEAGTSNLLYLTQETDPGALDGNSFFSDQLLANASSIGSTSTPALQRGHGNSATVALESQCPVVSLTCGNVELSQDNSALSSPGTLAPNVASIVITGNGNASILQSGGGNTAHLSLSDTGLGTITQSGSGNQASLTLSGLGNESSVNQTGNQNVANLTVTAGALGAGVHLTQAGGDTYTATIITNSSVTYTHFGP